jgi:hypothetical protein
MGILTSSYLPHCENKDLAHSNDVRSHGRGPIQGTLIAPLMYMAHCLGCAPVGVQTAHAWGLNLLSSIN